MFDPLFEAANSIVPKFSDEDRARLEKDMQNIMMGSSWDHPRSRLYIIARMAEFERSNKVLGVKIKLLEALLNR